MSRSFLTVLVISLFFASCNSTGIENREDFIEQNNIEEKALIPDDINDPRWKVLAGYYKFLVEDLDFGGSKKCFLIIENKKEKQIVSSLVLNRFLIPGRPGREKYRNRFLVPYERMARTEYEYMNDMSE